MVATLRRVWVSMTVLIRMLSVATVRKAQSSFLYPGRVRSLLPSATAHTWNFPSRFSIIFMSDKRACFRSSGESDLAWTG